VRALLDHALRRVYPTSNPTLSEEIVVVGIGGYGRGELAPFSDIDLMFLYPYKRTPLVEQLAEFLVLRLTDTGFKVSAAGRSVDECIRFARDDVTILTALLDARFVWGSMTLLESFQERFRREVVSGREAAFVESILAQRDERHRRMGDSRYLLEPNIKEGKGGLRDLQALMWLGRFLFAARTPEDLVRCGILDQASRSIYAKAGRFLWTVRWHLHDLSGRAQERLTFELQPRVAAAMRYRDRGRTPAVERFMKHYFLVARDVGYLTRVVCAALEEQHRRRPRLRVRFAFGRRRFGDFVVIGNRLSVTDPGLFSRRPFAIVELFATAQERELDIHPDALRAVSRNLRWLSAAVRDEPERAGALFLQILTSPKDPALTLGRMNDAGVLARLVPEFARITGQMQYTLYHIYTTDEHTIRAIEVLHRIEKGELADDHPLSTTIFPHIRSRTELYLALFLHDIGKGRNRPHSEVGAEIADRICRRFGLSDTARETVVWLVRHHLLMPAYAFKRDIDDPATIADFVSVVQSPERLRLLLLLTVADIRAVGPNVWNAWKGQLLRDLYIEAAAAMAAGDVQGRRLERARRAREELAAALAALDPPWPPQAIEAWLERHDTSYLLSFPLRELVRHAIRIREVDRTADGPLLVDFTVRPNEARTEVMVYTQDHPGLFLKLAGALALSGASILDARIFTTSDGMALDFFGFQQAAERRAIDDPGWLDRIRRNIERVVRDEIRLERELGQRLPRTAVPEAFRVEPRVSIDNRASRDSTVIEVEGRDRPGLLYALARALREHNLVTRSAHISTFGERAVDVFYVRDVFGMKIVNHAKCRRLEEALRAVLDEQRTVGP
jgi:[protein-PII] uridylyltransferase